MHLPQGNQCHRRAKRLRMFWGNPGGGAQGRNRTTDTVIFSHVLYQLSYLGARNRPSGRARRRLYRGSGRACLAQEALRSL